MSSPKKEQVATMRHHLEKIMQEEKARARINQLKIRNQWRKIMRTAKVEALQEEITILAQTHDRDVDQKDAMMHKLDRYLDDADEQLQVFLRLKFEHTESLLSAQRKDLTKLEESFKAELLKKKDEFNTERRHIQDMHRDFVKEMEVTSDALFADEKEQEQMSNLEHEINREVFKNKLLEDTNGLRIELESKIEIVEQHFEVCHIKYLKNSAQLTSKFKYLSRRDSDLSKEMRQRLRSIDRLEYLIKACTTKLSQHSRLCKIQQTALAAEKKGIKLSVFQLKAKMKAYRASESERRLQLTKGAFNTKESLESHTEQAERILTLSSKASKLESEQEMFTSFGSTNKEDPNPLSRIDAKHNKVLFDKLVVERELSRLREEHSLLIKHIQKHVDETTIGTESCTTAPPLLIKKAPKIIQETVLNGAAVS